jgi:hypothetical protein
METDHDTPAAPPVFGFISNHPALIEFEGEGGKSKAIILGVNSAFLIVKIPKPAGGAKSVASGSPVVVKFERSGTIMGFRSRVLSYMQQPCHLLFLASPKEIEHINLRRQTRIECHIPVDVSVAGAAGAGQLLDLSAAGCRIAVFSRGGGDLSVLAPGAETRMHLDTGGPARQTFTGVVRNVRECGGLTVIGVMFHKDVPGNAAVVELVRDLDAARRAGAVIDEADIDYVRDVEQGGGGGQRQTAPYTEKSRLRPGMAVYCSFAGGSSLERTSILAVDGGDFLILDFERLMAQGNVPATAAGVRIVFTRESACFSFRSPVTKFVTSPRPMVFCNCPGKFDVFMLRKTPRLGCLIPAGIESNLFRGRGYLSDLSEGGCRLVSPFGQYEILSRLPGKYAVSVHFAVDGSRCETVRAVTRRFHDDGDAVILGLAFEDEREKLEAVRRAVARLQASFAVGSSEAGQAR